MFYRLLFLFSLAFANLAFAQSQSQLPLPSSSPSISNRGTAGLLNGQQPTPNMIANSGAFSAEEEKADEKLNLPLKPLSAFQQFVFESTGRLLPNFGEASLQKMVSKDSLNQPVSADYEIGAGDEIFIRAWGAIDVNVQAKVDRDGQLTIPSVGTFPVAGVKARNLDGFLTSEVGKYYKNFNLSATLGKLGGVSIYVAGQALAPGMHTVNSTSTLSSVLFSVAQPGLNGSFRDVQLKRGGETVATFDLYTLMRSGELTGDRKLQAGDVVFIGQAGKRVALNIDGPAAAIFELKDGETLDDLLLTAGVDKTLLRQDTVQIEGFDDRNPKSPRGVEQIAYSRALKEAQLKDGDVVTIFQARRDFSNAVTLKGAVADPARYPHVAGMTVADLIPNTDVLIDPDYFRKKSALVGYNKQQADRAYMDERLYQSMSIEEQMEQQQRLSLLSNPFQRDPATGALSDNSSGQFLSDQRQKARLDSVEETIKNLLPQLNWDYAVIERLNRDELKPVLLPFNLKKAMARDPQHNLQLQPGDVVTIFSATQAEIPRSRKTALIKVTGEVAAPGYYQISSGETLRDVLVKAGGLTEDAYLFGTKLTRKAILIEQEKQYQRALDQAERLLLASSNRSAASAINPADAANVQVQTANQQQHLEKLRSSRPDGRVVLDVKPEAKSVAHLPPLTLEDGDSISVPSMPGQIAIFGSVYSQGAFAYRKGQTVFDYLSLAGGAAKSSDKGSIFVLRANGTVDSAQQGWVPFVSGLYGKKALPGDTIYVPEDFNRVSAMKGLLDVSQIFYQVGLGAAAIQAIKD